MKLKKHQILLVSFVLFSLFFGAGNLIFPPFLGQSAGSATYLALTGFLITAVLLPILGVIVVAKFNGLDKLGQLVSRKFGIIFAVIIYLSIGPGLGIPRAASVPFEMAVKPYLFAGANTKLFMLLYSFVFFAIALWLCMTPSKLFQRIGRFLTPTLLTLLVFLFVNFLIRGKVSVTPPTLAYENLALLQGFKEGYNTMDAIAALNFGLVIATTLSTFAISEKKDIMKYTILAGIFAGLILTSVYFMLAYMGMASSGVYSLQENGAWTLRQIVYQIFGPSGSLVLASIFTLACLTTCVGLINSISQYFSTLFKKVNYQTWVFLITGFSFLVCNLGLNTILSISVPVLNAIYPTSICLILMGLSYELWKNNKYMCPLVIGLVTLESVIFAFSATSYLSFIPLYAEGYGWLSAAALGLILALVLNTITSKKA